MSKILDLSIYKEETLDITMPDSTLLHITKPTQAMVIKVLQLRNIDDKSEPEEIIKGINSLVEDILNTNKEKKEIAREEVEVMPLQMKMAIINAYTEFLTGIQNNPN